MSIFKRGKIYWYHFILEGQHIQESTKQTNRTVARQMEAAHRTRLAMGRVGIVERKPAPVLREFAVRFIEAIEVRSAEKPQTIRFYKTKLDRLLEFEPLASASLDKIDESLIERYVQVRVRKAAPATVNREMATLRRLLRLAYEWQIVNRVPRIRMLSGERNREFVLSHEQEQSYLAIAPQPLKDVAILILETGLRVGEAVALLWSDVHIDPINGALYGYLRIRDGKSRNALRNLSLTMRAQAMLRNRYSETSSEWVFPGKGENAFLVTSLGHQHEKVRNVFGSPKDFVIHSLRHTMLTRLGEAGVDAFTIMRIAGHSSITVSQRYVHPSPEAMERAFEKLEALNNRASIRQTAKTLRPATNPATLQISPSRKLPVNSSLKRLGPLAQWLEQRTHNPLVGGSNPPGAIHKSSQEASYPIRLCV
jgi:integrase